MPNRVLMLHPTGAGTLSRDDFKAEAERIDNIYKIENFISKPLRGKHDMWMHLNEILLLNI